MQVKREKYKYRGIVTESVDNTHLDVPGRRPNSNLFSCRNLFIWKTTDCSFIIAAEAASFHSNIY